MPTPRLPLTGRGRRRRRTVSSAAKGLLWRELSHLWLRPCQCLLSRKVMKPGPVVGPLFPRWHRLSLNKVLPGHQARCTLGRDVALYQITGEEVSSPCRWLSPPSCRALHPQCGWSLVFSHFFPFFGATKAVFSSAQFYLAASTRVSELKQLCRLLLCLPLFLALQSVYLIRALLQLSLRAISSLAVPDLTKRFGVLPCVWSSCVLHLQDQDCLSFSLQHSTDGRHS